MYKQAYEASVNMVLKKRAAVFGTLNDSIREQLNQPPHGIMADLPRGFKIPQYMSTSDNPLKNITQEQLDEMLRGIALINGPHPLPYVIGKLRTRGLNSTTPAPVPAPTPSVPAPKAYDPEDISYNLPKPHRGM